MPARDARKTAPNAKRTRVAMPAALRGIQLPLPGIAQITWPSPVSTGAEYPDAVSATAISKHKTSAISASAKYVFEREQRRLTISDIPKHLVYDGFLGEARFAGLRVVDGEHLALLARGADIVVAPVSEATAQRLKRLAKGDPVMVGRNGVIRKKGRSR